MEQQVKLSSHVKLSTTLRYNDLLSAEAGGDLTGKQ